VTRGRSDGAEEWRYVQYGRQNSAVDRCTHVAKRSSLGKKGGHTDTSAWRPLRSCIPRAPGGSLAKYAGPLKL
jgi:hypothetical protein